MRITQPYHALELTNQSRDHVIEVEPETEPQQFIPAQPMSGGLRESVKIAADKLSGMYSNHSDSSDIHDALANLNLGEMVQRYDDDRLSIAHFNSYAFTRDHRYADLDAGTYADTLKQLITEQEQSVPPTRGPKSLRESALESYLHRTGISQTVAILHERLGDRYSSEASPEYSRRVTDVLFQRIRNEIVRQGVTRRPRHDQSWQMYVNAKEGLFEAMNERSSYDLILNEMRNYAIRQHKKYHEISRVALRNGLWSIPLPAGLLAVAVVLGRVSWNLGGREEAYNACLSEYLANCALVPTSMTGSGPEPKCAALSSTLCDEKTMGKMTDLRGVEMFGSMIGSFGGGLASALLACCQTGGHLRDARVYGEFARQYKRTITRLDSIGIS